MRSLAIETAHFVICAAFMSRLPWCPGLLVVLVSYVDGDHRPQAQIYLPAQPTRDDNVAVVGRRNRPALADVSNGAGVDRLGALLTYTPPPRPVKTHAAPAPLLSSCPPTMAVLPSPDNATDQP